MSSGLIMADNSSNGAANSTLASGSRSNTGGGGMNEAGPLDEIAYWHARARDLGNIRLQLNRSDVSHIVSVLRQAKSFYYL